MHVYRVNDLLEVASYARVRKRRRNSNFPSSLFAIRCAGTSLLRINRRFWNLWLCSFGETLIRYLYDAQEDSEQQVKLAREVIPGHLLHDRDSAIVLYVIVTRTILAHILNYHFIMTIILSKLIRISGRAKINGWSMICTIYLVIIRQARSTIFSFFNRNRIAVKRLIAHPRCDFLEEDVLRLYNFSNNDIHTAVRNGYGLRLEDKA